MPAKTPPTADALQFVRVTPSGEIYLKSRRTRDRFMAQLIGNVRDALGTGLVGATVRRSGHHELSIEADDLDTAARISSQVFGVRRVERVERVDFDTLEQLSKIVAEMSRPRVVGHKFAVRVRRRGSHEWQSRDAEVEIGRMLLDDSAGVDLSHPDVTVRVHVQEQRALVVEESLDGPDGLPLGTQAKALVLLSGGIDSPVAAWMLMRRGCPVDFLHLKLDCSVSDHALVVGDELIRSWGHGSDPIFHVIDFQRVKRQLQNRVAPGLRQVVLKQLMLAAAAELARRRDLQLLVTGDSLGQVSSQTAAHLAVIDGFVKFPILRPLVGMTKDEIIARARAIRTYDLSIRAREVCDLSEGKRVETKASQRRLETQHRKLDTDLVDEALASREQIRARDWLPGLPLEPSS